MSAPLILPERVRGMTVVSFERLPDRPGHYPGGIALLLDPQAGGMQYAVGLVYLSTDDGRWSLTGTTYELDTLDEARAEQARQVEARQ